mmetsp:Transcript_28739/g.54282  ORF Transcript_28739/g.54282 Transcript_28739/m.54282 type:complete len:81 (+) Transcript_28739:200-442(+)
MNAIIEFYICNLVKRTGLFDIKLRHTLTIPYNQKSVHFLGEVPFVTSNLARAKSLTTTGLEDKHGSTNELYYARMTKNFN